MQNQEYTTEEGSATWSNATRSPGEPDYTQALPPLFFLDPNFFSGACWLYAFVLYVAFVCPLCVLGLIGNGLTLAVLSKEKSKSATFFLLKCLAVSDSFVLLCWTTLQHYGSLVYFENLRAVLMTHSLSIFVAMQPFCAASQSIATWLVVMVTWHRYIAVCLPHKVASLGSLPGPIGAPTGRGSQCSSDHLSVTSLSLLNFK